MSLLKWTEIFSEKSNLHCSLHFISHSTKLTVDLEFLKQTPVLTNLSNCGWQKLSHISGMNVNLSRPAWNIHFSWLSWFYHTEPSCRTFFCHTELGTLLIHVFCQEKFWKGYTWYWSMYVYVCFLLRGNNYHLKISKHGCVFRERSRKYSEDGNIHTYMYLFWNFKQPVVVVVCLIYFQYLGTLDLAPVFSIEEFKHWFIPRKGIVDSYVVEVSILIGVFLWYNRSVALTHCKSLCHRRITLPKSFLTHVFLFLLFFFKWKVHINPITLGMAKTIEFW